MRRVWVETARFAIDLRHGRPGHKPSAQIAEEFLRPECLNESSCWQKISILRASLAQLVEHALRKRMVAGWIPAGGFYLNMFAMACNYQKEK